jgi:hypothetical protein
MSASWAVTYFTAAAAASGLANTPFSQALSTAPPASSSRQDSAHHQRHLAIIESAAFAGVALPHIKPGADDQGSDQANVEQGGNQRDTARPFNGQEDSYDKRDGRRPRQPDRNRQGFHGFAHCAAPALATTNASAPRKTLGRIVKSTGDDTPALRHGKKAGDDRPTPPPKKLLIARNLDKITADRRKMSHAKSSAPTDPQRRAGG